MIVTATAIPDVLLLQPRLYNDDRGFFAETYQAHQFAEYGITMPFLQDNHSRSSQGTLRGLHYQIRQAQGKLVRVVTGEVFDVAVDIRTSSPTFGKWISAKLSSENFQQLWIPPGFAHGIYILSEWADVTYKVTNYYAPEWERTLIWNDPDLSINWPLIGNKDPILSEKDAHGEFLKNAETFNQSFFSDGHP